MNSKERRQKKFFRWIGITLIIAAATYGFASANTLNITSLSGQGFGLRSIFEVSKINYTLDAENPEYFTEVHFTLENQDQPVHAGVSVEKNSEVTWAESCHLEGSGYSCSFEPRFHVLEADWLHVVALR
jgi:hypothetical protein